MGAVYRRPSRCATKLRGNDAGRGHTGSASWRRPRAWRRRFRRACTRWPRRCSRAGRPRSCSIRNAFLRTGISPGDDADPGLGLSRGRQRPELRCDLVRAGRLRLVPHRRSRAGRSRRRGPAQALSRLQRRRHDAGGPLRGRVRPRRAWPRGAGHLARGGDEAAGRALAWLVDGAPDALEPSVRAGGKAAAFNVTILSQLLGTPAAA